MSWYCRLNWQSFHGLDWRLCRATVLGSKLYGWLWRTSELSGLWPRSAYRVRCHGDHPHHVCLLRACHKLTSVVSCVRFTDKTVPVVSVLSAAAIVEPDSIWSSPERSVPTLGGHQVGPRQTSSAVNHGDLNSWSRRIPRTGLRTCGPRLVRQHLVPGGKRFPDCQALRAHSSSAVGGSQALRACSSSTVSGSQAPRASSNSTQGFTVEETSFPEEKAPWPEAWFVAVRSPREPTPAQQTLRGTMSRVFVRGSPVPLGTDSRWTVRESPALWGAGSSWNFAHCSPVTPAGLLSVVVRLCEESTPAGLLCPW